MLAACALCARLPSRASPDDQDPVGRLEELGLLYQVLHEARGRLLPLRSSAREMRPRLGRLERDPLRILTFLIQLQLFSHFCDHIILKQRHRRPQPSPPRKPPSSRRFSSLHSPPQSRD